MFGLFEVVGKTLCNALSAQWNEALVGLDQFRGIQTQLQPPVAYQLIETIGSEWPVCPGIGAQVEIRVTINDQQADRAMPLNLKGQSPRLLEIGGDQGGDGAHLAKQAGKRGRVVPILLQGAPDIREMDDGATNIDGLKKETLYLTGLHS